MSKINYIFLGIQDSGRFDILKNIIDEAFDETAPVLIILSTKDLQRAEDHPISKIKYLSFQSWDNYQSLQSSSENYAASFLLNPSNLSPIDTLEALAEELTASKTSINRIFTVVHASLLAKHPSLMRWYDACIHFSDYVFINKRETGDNKWLSQFKEHYSKQYYPCIFETIKSNKVQNLGLALSDDARRISQAFDLDPEKEVEPYFERTADGSRRHTLPNLQDYL